MAGASGPNLIDSGLVLALDAADSYNFNLTAVEVLVVAGGGGGGGGDVGAGGGAGGLIYNSNFTVTPGSAVTVTVGDGGAGSSNASVDGSNGSNSVFGSLTAIGGGGGASWGSGSGQNGGSGGGSVSTNAVGQGTAGQGNNGGNGLAGPDYPQGGGGGAGGVGQTATIQTKAGDGGVGLEFPQFASVGGSPAGWFAGGGGGGVEANTSGNSCIVGSGGLGGGGNGGRQAGTRVVATSGVSNTGGGGGGDDPGQGGNGGSGIVIVRYPGPQRAIGGTVSSVGGYTIHTFTTVGSTTFTPLVATNNSTILGLADLSNNNRFATTAGSPIYSNEKEGNIFFEGTDEYIEIPFETILNDCSIEVIFKATSTRLYQYLLSIGNGSNSSYSFYLDMNDPDSSGFAQTMWAYWNSGGTPYSVIPKTGTYGNWNDSTWRHYVFTRGSTTNHYMNGNIVQNVSRAGDQTIQFGNGSGYKLRIASYQTNALYFTGNVASVKIYNKELTASEIKQNYNAIKKRFGLDYDIITNNLVLHLDAGSINSYPGTGDVWYNISPTGGYISKGTYLPSFTTLGGITCFNFNQVGAYFQNDNFFTQQVPSDQTNLTIDVWFYPATTELSSGDRGNLVRGNNGNAFYMSWNKDNQKQSNYWYGKSNEGYHESGAAITRGTWNNIVAVWNSSGLSQFLNGAKTTATTSGTSASKTSGIQIGWEGNDRQFSGGIAIIKMYDAALTDSQVQQNFNATRSRFGI